MGSAPAPFQPAGAAACASDGPAAVPLGNVAGDPKHFTERKLAVIRMAAK
jgi:hypothetical protein